jgi:hypothetical protein
MIEIPKGIAQARVGDWLVEPGPPGTRMWRWGRIMAVLPDGDHLVVRWYGDSHETVVLPSVDARIENSDREPRRALAFEAYEPNAALTAAGSSENRHATASSAVIAMVGGRVHASKRSQRLREGARGLTLSGRRRPVRASQALMWRCSTT